MDDGTLKFESGKLVRWMASGKSSKENLDSILTGVSEDKRVLSLVTIGINPLLRYGYASDRFVSGSIGLGGFGFTAILRSASLKIGDKIVVNDGRLVNLSSSRSD